jgi:hypothetical protein
MAKVVMSKKNRDKLGALINSIECYYIVMEGVKRRFTEGKITHDEYFENMDRRAELYNRDVKELNELFGLSITSR